MQAWWKSDIWDSKLLRHMGPLGTLAPLGKVSSQELQFDLSCFDKSKFLKPMWNLYLFKHMWQFVTRKELLLLISLISIGGRLLKFLVHIQLFEQKAILQSTKIE